MPRFVILLLAIVCFAGSGCRDFTVDTEKDNEDLPGFRQFTVSGSDPFEISVGDTAFIEGTDLSIYFSHLLSDSRCPANVQCIQAGEAQIFMELYSGDQSSLQVVALIPGMVPTPHLGNDVVQFQDYRLQLLQLSPYPVNGDENYDESDYTALVSFLPVH